jgi:hypothetical protein
MFVAEQTEDLSLLLLRGSHPSPGAFGANRGSRQKRALKGSLQTGGDRE